MSYLPKMKAAFAALPGVAILLTGLAVNVPAAHAQSAGSPTGQEDPPSATCSAVSVPVSLAPGAAKTDHISGELCVPAGPTPSTVQVLVAGATYDRSYWNFPYEPPRYSYVWAAAAAGYATLDIDPLGTGMSSHPLSTLVTIQTGAYTVHQVIQAVRSGALGTAFARVILVSHSMGTALAWNEVADYHDVSGLIATGNVHLPSPAGTVNAALKLYPAFLDPKFASAGLDPGYLTTEPGTRSVFYNTADADPAVIAEDEALKQPVTAAYLATYFTEDVNLDTSRITVPVLLAVGQNDSIMCGPLGTNCSTSAALLNAEAPFYGNHGTCLQAYVLPNAGHDIDLSLNAQDFFNVATRWADRWVGNGLGAALLKGLLASSFAG